MSSILLDTLHGKTTSRPPVWFMRQAGRVLPNYNKLKERYTFRELMHDPKLAASVTLMPVRDLDVDAAILFSDILVIPEAMGMEITFTDKGPVFSNPLKEAHVPDLLRPDPTRLEYIYRVIDHINRSKPADIPLIGFCGAPLTTLCYMIQGVSAEPAFPEAIRFLYTNRKEVQKLIDAITELSIHYALKQIEHGVGVFQLFETHAGLVPATLYRELFLPAVKKISSAVRGQQVPFIFFPKGLGTGLRYITPDIADFAGIDWQVPITHARELVHPEVGLQGNLDPRILYAPLPVIESELKKFIPFFQQNPKWIFNLGHGFLPDTPYRHARFLTNRIKQTCWNT